MIKSNVSKGQAILFAVVGVTVALAIGVTVASRNLTSSSRVSRSDTASRAYAAAEGGIERMLALTDSALDTLAVYNPACSDAGFILDSIAVAPISGTCKIEFPPNADDKIPSSAVLKVEVSSASSSMVIDNGYTKEVVLYDGVYRYPGATIRICWDNPKAALSYFSYNTSGSAISGGLFSSTNSSVFPDYSNIYQSGVSFTQSTGAASGFPYCNTVSVVSPNAYGLRIKALFDSTGVGVFPTSGYMPKQGYKLTSVGKVGQTNEVTKTVIVYRSYAYMPGFFDSAIYTSTGTIN